MSGSAAATGAVSSPDGRLSGDIRIESEKGRVFIPITSMLIVSIVLSVLMNILKR